MADAPSKQKSSDGSAASGKADTKAVGSDAGTEPKSVEDVLSMCQDSGTLSRQDHKERADTMRRVRQYLDALPSPLDPGEAEALSQALGALRYTPTRQSPEREGDGTPYEQLLEERGDRQQAWDELMQSLREKSR